jgi:hypothetical protein
MSDYDDNVINDLSFQDQNGKLTIILTKHLNKKYGSVESYSISINEEKNKSNINPTIDTVDILNSIIKQLMVMIDNGISSGNLVERSNNEAIFFTSGLAYYFKFNNIQINQTADTFVKSCVLGISIAKRRGRQQLSQNTVSYSANVKYSINPELPDLELPLLVTTIKVVELYDIISNKINTIKPIGLVVKAISKGGV